MKKLMMLALGLCVALSTVSFAAPQDPDKKTTDTDSTSKKKKKKKKKADTTATDKKM